ncbi:hypothetical protein GTP55_23255 [Duganella sp. FT109W]|uniref:Uncharacterized protein n=1 Tax=Duganella margarita TaxID=2692170 RepID=A0ABW9WM85_9BURK|nr:hypothetical protein [Duganella margarita]MYN42264.1 hypothetical protein [Duganella margarita]
MNSDTAPAATSGRAKAGAQVMGGAEQAGKPTSNLKGRRRLLAGAARRKLARRLAWTVVFSADEYQALQALRRALRAASGRKLGKSMLLRLACRLLLRQPRRVIDAELAALPEVERR